MKVIFLWVSRAIFFFKTTGSIIKRENLSNENKIHQPLGVSLQLPGSDSEVLSSSESLYGEFSVSAK